jgi:uncharacterized OB-fold protein
MTTMIRNILGLRKCKGCGVQTSMPDGYCPACKNPTR